MEVRFINNFNIEHKFIEEVEKLKKDPNFKDNNIFNRYNSKTVTRLLNEVATIGSINPNLV